uniref:hypothetical protein n=1 Tax=Novacetimonas hansenii TaxID=436 RepID=UPI0023B2979E|nr:hypothetical protein [Novacetimonas hansenii]
MRMPGVPVIHPHPVQFRAEVFFHLPDQFAGVALEVGHIRRVLGRDDETEMVTVVLAAFGERLRVGIVDAGTKQPRLFTILRHALPAQVTQMGGERRLAPAMTNDTGLDGDTAGTTGQQTIGPGRRDTATPKGRAGTAAVAARSESTTSRPLGRGESLGDEGPEPLGTRRADATQTGPEVILARHHCLQCAEKPGATRKYAVGKHCW